MAFLSDIYNWFTGGTEEPANSNRLERFTQSSQNGIVMYEKSMVDAFVKQYEEHCPKSYDGILNQLNSDLLADKGNFKIFWNDAKSIFLSNPAKYRKAIKMQNEKDFPDECHIALICYSMGHKDSNVYAEFNKESREVCEGKKKFSSISNKALFFLLRYVMENKSENSTNLPTINVYRGCDTNFLSKEGSGNLLGFGHFTSTSVDQKIGKGFANTYGPNSTTFQIEDVNGRNRTKFINLFDHSVYQGEKEYLLSPFQLYAITKTETIGKHTTVHLSLR
jgi:hypothetical protein